MSAAEETQKPDTPKKSRTKVKEKSSDPSRFHGNGVNFKAKLIGVEDVLEPRGDRMCQEAMQRLKSLVKSAGEHKLRILINVSLEGLKIVEEKSGNICHHHAVQKISFIARDITDARAFGYIYSPGDGRHQFFGIKTEKAAEALVLTLRDLFQVVFEMKKKEVEEAKRQKELYDNRENMKKEDHFDRTSTGSKDSNRSEGANKPAKCGGNLLNLESELETLEQGLQQINVFGQQQCEAVHPPPSPGNWSAGSDSWGTPATPQSVNLSGSGSQSVLHKETTESVMPAGGGFPTIPRPSHQMSPASVPSVVGPSTIHRPRSLQSQSSFATPPPKVAGWATFDSPSPPGCQSDAQTTFVTSFPDQPSQQIHSKLEAKLQAQSELKTAAIQPKDAISTSKDPFETDPFFVEPSSFTSDVVQSTTTTESAVDKIQQDAFTDFSQASFVIRSETSRTTNESNPFSDSVFEPSPPMASPPEGHGSVLNAAFASTPIQNDKEMQMKDAFGNLMALSEDDKTEKHVLKQASISKPNELQLNGDNKDVLATASDPFGVVSPATEAKLNTSVGVSNDPFDTSSLLMPKSHGPLDFSQLKPVSLKTSVPTDGDNVPGELSVIVKNHNDSPPEALMPSPSVPPPPLPTSSLPDATSKPLSQDSAPPPPPRSLPPPVVKQQASIDISGMTPPPIPKRPPLGKVNSPKLPRQATIQFPVEDEMPPPPPPRPGLASVCAPRLGSTGRTESLDSTTPPPPPPRPATEKSDMFTQAKMRCSNITTRTTISPIPRPRPRSKTPANTSTGLVNTENNKYSIAERPSSAAEFGDPFTARESSFGKSNQETFATSFPVTVFENSTQDRLADFAVRSQSPAVAVKNESFPDPFADVDPFASDDRSDPFEEMPDPFTMDSPADPFSKDFKGELFVTRAVTLGSGNPSEKSFTDNTSDNRVVSDGSNQDTSLRGDIFKFSDGDSTLKTDTSLEASVSLPFAYLTDSNVLSHVEDSSDTQNSHSCMASVDNQSKKSDPFEFDVFSNDFFKNQFSSVSTKTNASWMSVTDSANTTNTRLIENSVSGVANSAERVSPGLTPSSIPSSNNKDGDSSSNSEIADAFGDDANCHQVMQLTLASEGQCQAESSEC